MTLKPNLECRGGGQKGIAEGFEDEAGGCDDDVLKDIIGDGSCCCSKIPLGRGPRCRPPAPAVVAAAVLTRILTGNGGGGC